MLSKFKPTNPSFKAAISSNRYLRLAIVLSMLACLQMGCSGERFKHDPKLVPYKGVVTIDGEPAKQMLITLAKADEVDKFKKKQVRILSGPQTMTNDKGEFSFTSTFPDDGVPPGDYVVVFDWMPSGVDREFWLDGTPAPGIMKKYPPKLLPIHEKYSGGKSGNQDIKLETGKPQTDVKFDLTTKK